MSALVWLRHLVRRRSGRLVLRAIGIAMAVSLIASLGLFLNSSKATMTSRSISTVSVDWQVQVEPGADANSVLAATSSHAGVNLTRLVAFGQSTGLQFETAGTTQTTGPAIIVGVPEDFGSAFPGAIRQLTGSAGGVVLTQQTAANLHASLGSSVVVGRAGLPSATAVVDGIADLPQADSLFQKVGAPSGAQPQAPPDNVVIMPMAKWHEIFDDLKGARPDQTNEQVFARLNHTLPHDPAAAYNSVVGSAHNLEASLAGGGIVGNNIGSVLEAARSDALYAQILFVFLGLPGLAVAAMLTVALSDIGRATRRREQATLRSRGASVRQLTAIAGVEALAIGIVGAVIGLVFSRAIAALEFKGSLFGSSPMTSIGWGVGAGLVGIVMSIMSVALPAIRDARLLTVGAGRQTMERTASRVMPRVLLVTALLVGGEAVFRVTSRSGYTLVLAPEGTPTLSVDYWAFTGPTLLWLAIGVGTWTAVDLLLGRAPRLVERLIEPVAGKLANLGAQSMRYRRRALAFTVSMICVSVAFAASTSIFNSTYKQQAEVDARLSNGADVTVSYVQGAIPTPSATAIKRISGVRRTAQLQHRFAYVGSDLQDLYGISADEIATVTSLPDAYFQGGTAQELLAKLQSQPDALLVSAETVKDYQLQPGDSVKLRLTKSDAASAIEVPFRYVGIAKEFPTAPKDSFLIANAAYIAETTGDGSANTLLINSGSAPPGGVAERVRSVVGPGATVTDINSARLSVGSSLTAVDLSKLTKLELVYALAFAVGATGLALALAFNERRKMMAVVKVLGASDRQLRRLVESEAMVVSAIGLGLGAICGLLLSVMLTKVLNGVFDPPPAHLAIPFTYLGAVGGSAIVSAAAAAYLIARRSQRAPIEEMRSDH